MALARSWRSGTEQRVNGCPFAGHKAIGKHQFTGDDQPYGQACN